MGNQQTLGGKTQNKTLSDNPEPALVIQGIGWLTRKAIGLATVTLHVHEYVNDTTGRTHFDIAQTATGGLKGTTENRIADDEWREHADWLFGRVKGRTRWLASRADIPSGDPFLGGNWSEDEADELLYGYVESLDSGWTAAQVWGFKVVNGERRHVRNVVVAKGSARAEVRMVYDFVSE